MFRFFCLIFILIVSFSVFVFSEENLVTSDAKIITSNYYLKVTQSLHFNSSHLQFSGKFPAQTTEVSLVFSPDHIIKLSKNNDLWVGEIYLNPDLVNTGTCQIYMRFGQFKLFASSFYYKSSEKKEEKISLTYLLIYEEVGRKLFLFNNSVQDLDFQKYFGSKAVLHFSERNAYFGIKMPVSADQLVLKPSQNESFFSGFLRSDLIEQQFYTVEVKQINLTGNTANSLLIAGNTYYGEFDWRVRGNTLLWDMQYMSIFKTSYSNNPDYGENNGSLEKIYARMRKGELLLEFGDQSLNYSSYSFGGDVIGANLYYDLFWGINFQTFMGISNRKWDFLSDPYKSTKYLQSVSAYRLEKEWGHDGKLALYYVKGHDDPTSLNTPATDGPVDNQLIGTEFSIQSLFDKSLSVSGEYNKETINLDTRPSSNSSSKEAMAYQLKVFYRFNPLPYDVTLYISQVDPSYRSIGRTLQADRREWMIESKGYFFEKALKVTGRYKTSRDNLDNAIGKTTTIDTPRITTEYLISPAYPDLKLKFFLEQKTKKTSDSSTDLVNKLGTLSLLNTYYWLNYELGLSYQDELDNILSKTNERHLILNSIIFGRYLEWNPLGFNMSFEYTHDQEAIANSTETVFDNKMGVSLDIFKVAELKCDYQYRKRNRSSGHDDLSSIQVPLVINFGSDKYRTFTLEYKNDVYTFDSTSNNYNEQTILLKVNLEM